MQKHGEEFLTTYRVVLKIMQENQLQWKAASELPIQRLNAEDFNI